MHFLKQTSFFGLLHYAEIEIIANNEIKVLFVLRLIIQIKISSVTWDALKFP